MSLDILLYENGNGGDLEILGGDLATTETIFQQMYLALFGGNVEQNTPDVRESDEESFSWWANTLFFENQESRQFNSNTERAINNNVLNTSGRLAIETAVNTDLEYLRNISNFTSSVSILSNNILSISVSLEQPEGIQDREIQFIWDNVTGVEIIEKSI